MVRSRHGLRAICVRRRVIAGRIRRWDDARTDGGLLAPAHVLRFFQRVRVLRQWRRDGSDRLAGGPFVGHRPAASPSGFGHRRRRDAGRALSGGDQRAIRRRRRVGTVAVTDGRVDDGGRNRGIAADQSIDQPHRHLLQLDHGGERRGAFLSRSGDKRDGGVPDHRRPSRASSPITFRRADAVRANHSPVQAPDAGRDRKCSVFQ